MKRLICLCLLFCLILCGCTVGKKPVTLEKRTKLSENGTVSASVLKAVKEQNKACVFYSKSGKNEYEWTVFGNKIEKPKDINFNVEIKEKEDSLTVKTKQSGSFGLVATLSVYLVNTWDCDSVKVNDTTATVTKGKSSIINIRITKGGTYTVTKDFAGSSKTGADDTFRGKTTSKNASSALSSTKAYTEKKKDKYNTDPVPSGKPAPVNEEKKKIDKSEEYTCTFSVECTTVLNNLSSLNPEKLDIIPSDGVILRETSITFKSGESVYDVLKKACEKYEIPLASSYTPLYGSYYIEGINNLYERDCGENSGWMFRVNGWYPNYGCSRYSLKNGDKIEYRYTCDLGNDIGGGFN